MSLQDHRNKRENQTIEALRGSSVPLTAMGIVEIVYCDISTNLYKAAAINVLQHLEKLKKEGKVFEFSKKDGDSLWQFLDNKL